MSDRLYGKDFKWRSSSQDQYIGEVLQQWVGTPYCSNMQSRGVGVDCRLLIAAFYDIMLHRAIATPIRRVPPESGRNSTAAINKAVGDIIRGFDVENVTQQRVVFAGDALALRIGNESSPTHGALVGNQPGIIFHADMVAGVTMGSLMDVCITAVYRPRSRFTW